MTAVRAERADESTAIALREPAIGNLPAEVQQALQMRRLSNQVAGELAKQNWGKSLDLSTRRAVADWGQQFRVDVTTEIHVLGGNIYLNAAFYLRRLGEMIEQSLVEYAVADHVEDDARLKQLGAEGEGEYTRRLRERIAHQIPDKAASAVVFRVKLRSMTQEIVGVKWCGNGTRKNDPVGDDKPVETSESRAARRAMRLLASHVPQRISGDLSSIENAADSLSERVRAAKVRFDEETAANEIKPKALAQGDASDPYGVNSRRAIGAGQEPVAVVDNGLASQEQKIRITELLDRADLTDARREALAKEAGAASFTASAAQKMIALLEALVPQSGDGEFSLESEG
jgi:hypothetical protein